MPKRVQPLHACHTSLPLLTERAQGSPKSLEVTDLPPRFCARLLARQPGVHELVGQRLEMKVQLVAHVTRGIGAPEAQIPTPLGDSIVLVDSAHDLPLDMLREEKV